MTDCQSNVKIKDWQEQKRYRLLYFMQKYRSCAAYPLSRPSRIKAKAHGLKFTCVNEHFQRSYFGGGN